MVKKKDGKLRFKSNEAQTVLVISGYFNDARELIEDGKNDQLISLLDEGRLGVNDVGEAGGMSLLMVAAESGNLRIVQELIRRGADLNYQDLDDWNTLITATKEGNLDIVTELVEAGATLDATDMGGWTPLLWASYKGCLDIAKVLLKKGASANVFDNNNMTPLIYASGRGFLEITLMLLAHAAKPDTPDKYGTTPLIWTCRKGHIDIAQKLLKAGATVDAIGMYGWTPLLVAVRGNFENLVDLIITFKPNANACDADGLSALMIASKGGNINIVNALLRINSYVNLSDRNSDTSLIHASKSGYVLIVEALIKAHADVDHQGADKKTALYWSVEKGHVEVVRALLKANANLELATEDGDTPLLKAVRSRRLPIVKMLIDKKAKVTACDKFGDTALHISIRAQSKTIVEFLLRNPRNSQLLYKPNKRGETPFMLDNTHQKPILPTLFGATPSSRRVLEKETQLGYDLYSSAIANLLSEPTLKLPVCVGLFAKWGSGKSFLIGKLKDDLITFTQDWNISPTFRFSWSLFCAIFMLSIVTGVGTLVGTNGRQYFFGIITAIGIFFLCYCIFAIVYCGHLRYDWSISSNIRSRSDRLKLIIQVCFGNPPMLEVDQVSTLPVRFLFTEAPVKISSDYGVSQLITAILNSLWQSMENELGFLPVHLYKVFHPKHVSGLTWRWRRICMVPTIFLIILSFFTLAILLILYYVDKTEPFKLHPVLSYVLVAIASITGSWIVSNFIIPFKIIRELVFHSKKKTREELKKDVQLMQSCIMCLDSFIGKRQSRLVIILDALESIYESDRLITFLEGINDYFINFQVINANRSLSPPFVCIMTLDPHHHVTSKSKEYLKTIVHLPFYLQNSQLRKVKIAQTTVLNKPDYRSSTTSLVEAIAAAPIPHPSKGSTSGMIRSKSKKISNLKAADSVISLSGHGGESLTKVLLTDDYFSDVNPKSMRRIMNIVYIQGRLLKAFNLDFDWHRLTIWVNITEQWPLRASALIAYWDITENKFNDDSIPLKSLYDKVSPILPQDPVLLSRDNDEKKLNIFLSYHHNSLTLGDLKTFAPFTINLDPYLRKNLTEAWTDSNSIAQLDRPIQNPNAGDRKISTGTLPQPSSSGNISPHKLQLMHLSVDGVIAMLKQIEAFDHSQIDKYGKAIRCNNINGRVLSNCSSEDLNDLKLVLGFSFGDWLLFKSVLIDGRLPTLPPSVQISGATPTSGLPPGSEYQLIEGRLKSNLEKQVTMEEAALASAVVMDSPIEEDNEDNDEAPSPQEVGVLYIGNAGMNNRLSPSISFGDSDLLGSIIRTNHAIEIEPEPNDTTPLVSPSKHSIYSSSSSSSSSRRHPLERQGKPELSVKFYTSEL
ncbi:kinase D-interacting substrate of 220 kDa B-like isoform X2 [Panonychus citri]|uniref:kinase D-interacting substrate of 220 kDa B-like isoform X2 n=1 Tax=Panonychus citri TaxID=50023 RepID=UPI0023071601|nr:kinase D-interacting substrate of 220 kDa B-like isoform X2 [Panonychus citri]